MDKVDLEKVRNELTMADLNLHVAITHAGCDKPSVRKAAGSVAHALALLPAPDFAERAANKIALDTTYSVAGGPCPGTAARFAQIIRDEAAKDGAGDTIDLSSVKRAAVKHERERIAMELGDRYKDALDGTNDYARGERAAYGKAIKIVTQEPGDE